MTKITNDIKKAKQKAVKNIAFIITIATLMATLTGCGNIINATKETMQFLKNSASEAKTGTAELSKQIADAKEATKETKEMLNETLQEANVTIQESDLLKMLLQLYSDEQFRMKAKAEGFAEALMENNYEAVRSMLEKNGITEEGLEDLAEQNGYGSFTQMANEIAQNYAGSVNFDGNTIYNNENITSADNGQISMVITEKTTSEDNRQLLS